MTDKEKIKAYDEALEKAKEILEMTSDKSAIYTIFPELAESEDEKVRKAIIHFISHTPTVPKGIIGKETMIAWLEKQKVQPKQEWNEEDEKMFEKVILHVKKYQQIANPANETGESDLTDWLKSLKGRVQPKPEWSKEDEERLGSCIFCTQALAVENHVDSANTAWLKSIKGRVQPQNRWKPSKDQIDALEHFVRSVGESGYASPYENNTKLLYSLYEQLKKLKEE